MSNQNRLEYKFKFALGTALTSEIYLRKEISHQHY